MRAVDSPEAANALNAPSNVCSFSVVGFEGMLFEKIIPLCV